MSERVLEHFDLSGKTAMVTGATRGLGEVAATALAKAGAKVAVCGRSQADLERVSGKLRELGVESRGFELDVLDKAKVTGAVAKITAELGPVDILVNDAGVNYRVPVVEFPEEEWDRVINTNLKGYFLVAQAVAPGMLERGYGKVINMSSIFGGVGMVNQLAYASSKGGVNQMTKVMALEWAQQGVRVNAIAPTYFETELVTQIREDPERFAFINERTPMGRWGYLPELEGIVIFLASPGSDFITGQTIYIDGGWTAW
ncbi:MAG: SDR family oxidoreductase [Desulfarculaceae bacterium]|nr:SDR family oxidoreductase [Desulfarculaceae bacterium]MCF8074062.1 SDR family oxidoreductase [Desulfarculaceae bacterium]MCF8102100.1 SDR family oxidoreductase [Desulfarculaceae bacterium]MCF8117638.1 SDR family oxidoreductase [Desulfarculaceae bacterium]